MLVSHIFSSRSDQTKFKNTDYLVFHSNAIVSIMSFFEMEKALFRHDQESNLRKIPRMDACTSSHFKFLLGMGRTQETSCFNEFLTILLYDCN